MDQRSDREFPHVAVIGGGIAGLEALLALRDLAEGRVSLTLVSPEPDFSYRPLAVDEPFAGAPVERRELAPIAQELGNGFVQQALAGIDPERRALELADGSALSYDAAVICVGGRARPAYRDAVTFWSPGEPFDADELLRQSAAEDPKRMAFVVPPGVTWPLPLYEIALMSRRRAEELGLRDLELELVTPESAPLVMFGPLAAQAVAELLSARRIEIRSGAWASEAKDGSLVLTPGQDRLDANRVVALPLIDGPRIAGLPADEQGFIPIDEHARVKGVEDVYAAGDGTTFPIKQGGLGTQQADAAAEHIAARFGASVEPQPFRPVLRGKLFTGEESLSLKAEVAGGGGEGVASADYLWWPPHKVSGRYLAPWLAGEQPHRDPAPPGRSVDVEVALPHEWHREPMALDPYEPLGEG